MPALASFDVALSPPGKEGSQDLGRFDIAETGIDFRCVVAGWLGEDAAAMLNAAAFGVARGIVEPPDAGE